MSTLRAAVSGLFRPAPPPKLTCIGHSHTEPVTAAAADAGVDIDTINFWHTPDPFVAGARPVRLMPALGERLRAGVAFSLIGGAVHQDIGLVVHPRPFDFVWPERPDLPLAEQAEIIPFDALLDAVKIRARPYLDIMDAARAEVTGPFFHCESPPTYDAETYPRDDPGFAAFFGKDAVFSSPVLRYKLWRVHSGVIAAHCAEIGMIFVPHPPDSVTREGYLRPEFHGTPAHANLHYGALVLKQMLRLAIDSRR